MELTKPYRAEDYTDDVTYRVEHIKKLNENQNTQYFSHTNNLIP